MLELVATVVAKVMKRKLGTEDDIFQQGCNRYWHLHNLYSCEAHAYGPICTVFVLFGSGTQFYMLCDTRRSWHCMTSPTMSYICIHPFRHSPLSSLVCFLTVEVQTFYNVNIWKL